jgi:hypothetical protein
MGARRSLLPQPLWGWHRSPLWGRAVGLVVGLGLIGVGRAFKYHIQDDYRSTSKWSFTETYMYGSEKVRRRPQGSWKSVHKQTLWNSWPFRGRSVSPPC